MLNIGGIQHGVVMDHIVAGCAMDIYHYLELDKTDATVAIIKNAKSNVMGKKDIIKIEGSIELVDLDILGFIDHNITVNIIKDGAITLDKFLDIIKKEFSAEDFDNYKQLAERMSKLQPKKEGVSMLAESQIKGIFEGGALNNPDFWDNVFTVAKGTEKHTEVVNGVRTTIEVANHKNPMRFIAQKDLDGIIDNVKNYVKDIIKQAKNTDINADMLEKVCKKNMRMNIANWGIGFAISALFLSTIIPKIQYWITKVTTGSDEFPGVAEYDKKQ